MKSNYIPFEPLPGYCLCDAPGHETTDGGLLVPEAQIEDSDNTPIKLTVRLVGPGEQLDNGQRREVLIQANCTYFFLFPRYSLGGTLTFNGRKYVLVQSRFVCGRAL